MATTRDMGGHRSQRAITRPFPTTFCIILGQPSIPKSQAEQSNQVRLFSYLGVYGRLSHGHQASMVPETIRIDKEHPRLGRPEPAWIDLRPAALDESPPPLPPHDTACFQREHFECRTPQLGTLVRIWRQALMPCPPPGIPACARTNIVYVCAGPDPSRPAAHCVWGNGYGGPRSSAVEWCEWVVENSVPYGMTLWQPWMQMAFTVRQALSDTRPDVGSVDVAGTLESKRPTSERWRREGPINRSHTNPSP
ncbi:hypothetical protein QBC39DRAFT_336257 [Podospora conica]|nr:hypothetical protein QBC39DRAFT_336257 [Schizothecium conicum]